MREQGVKGPLYHPDHDRTTCPECARVAKLKAQAA